MTLAQILFGKGVEDMEGEEEVKELLEIQSALCMFTQTASDKECSPKTFGATKVWFTPASHCPWHHTFTLSSIVDSCHVFVMDNVDIAIQEVPMAWLVVVLCSLWLVTHWCSNMANSGMLGNCTGHAKFL